MKGKRFLAAATAGAIIMALGVLNISAAPSTTTVVVTANDLYPSTTVYANAWTSDKWFFYNDENDTIDNSLGTFVPGPGTPPAGKGSAQVSVSGTQRRNLSTFRFRGTALADITTLRFSTYNPSAGNGGGANRSGFLVLNVDFNGSDTWQRRLTFVPSKNGTVIPNSWQEWDAINNGNAMWGYSGTTWPVAPAGPHMGQVGISGGTLRSWSDILADYPNVRIRVTDGHVGIRVGEPYANGYTENIDAFKFGTAAGTTTFDFEPAPTTKDECKADGYQNFTDPSTDQPFKNQGQCIQYVNTGK